MNMDKHPRTGVWRYRKAVPSELRPHLPGAHQGKRELVQSLSTKDDKDARRRYLDVAPLMEALLDQARTSLTHATSNTPIPQPQPTPTTSAPWAATIEALKAEVDSFSLPLNIAVLTGALVPAGGFGDAEPAAPVQAAQSAPKGHTLREVWNAYSRERKLSEDRAREYLGYVEDFCQFNALSLDTDIGAFTKAHVRDYIHAMVDFPRITRGKEFRRLSVKQCIAKAIKESLPRISDASRQLRLAALSAVFKFAAKTYDLAVDPTWGLTVAVDKKARKRPSYNETDLKTIFDADFFKEATWCHFQWLPILGLYTGARLEELGALRLEDVKTTNGIWYFSLRETDDDGNFVRTLKTANSTRDVPIHSAVVQAGFLSYLEAMNREGHTYLFPDLSTKDEKRSSGFSTWWMRKRNTLWPHMKRKSFHSFRHTFKDACRKVIPDEEVRDRLTGHANGSVGRYYGVGQDVEVLATWLEKVSYEVVLPRAPT